MMKQLLLNFLVFGACIGSLYAQTVPILNYSVNNFGQVQLQIEAEADKYYILSAAHPPDFTYISKTSMTMGVNGLLTITEPAGAYPANSYTITAHSIAAPADSDGDGVDDVTEYNNMPTQSPFNFAAPVPPTDGTVAIDNLQTFSDLSVVDDNIGWAPFLNGQEFVKFAIVNFDTDNPKVYFINSETHFIHASFLSTLGNIGGSAVTGEVVYNPNQLLPNGVVGAYSFNFSFGNAYSFSHTQKTFELLIANMPYLHNNLVHFIGENDEDDYLENYQADYVGTRLRVVLESVVFADINYIPFHKAEGYGYFKAMTLDENPGSRDIVLYDALPNSLPRVGGIITSVIQTPLSHVNLRAIQDNVPNAYIKNPLAIDSIAELLGKYIYYKVEDEQYFIREATLAEVNDWYEAIRPTEPQTPIRDLSFTEILPLDSINFSMSTAFGAKCSNVATMRTFGFPMGTIPNGFGVPFHFYDEFMKYNNFYERVENMLANPNFINDLATRIEMLDDFRDDIEDAPMPQWMLDKLQTMHDSFPLGTSVRCRSSTNNEDLPGFSGAGLYTSKTHHLGEGHISKTIKEIYASMWNFRAFDERDFYRIDQYVAAMGVLCHPNYEDEKSNGVGVSIDPIYQTQNTFYLNTQIGEQLITNPDANAIPEEMLLYQDSAQGFFILRASNLVNAGQVIMDQVHINLLRDYLQVIHDEFIVLYDLVGVPGFGMDIEYKVTAQNQLVIKQARPWVSFWAGIKANYDLGVDAIIEPHTSASLGNSELITAKISNRGLKDMHNYELSLVINNQLIETMMVSDTLKRQLNDSIQFSVPYDFSSVGDYNITIIVSHPEDGYANNDTMHFVVKKIYQLEGSLVASEANFKCAGEIEVTAVITNLGESPLTTAAIEVMVNGVAVDTVLFTLNLEYLQSANISFIVNENLIPIGNQIALNILRLNGQLDAVFANNSTSITADLQSNYDYITLVIKPDNYPIETSWRIIDKFTNEVIASDHLTNGSTAYAKDICVDYSSCYIVKLYDTFGDGICCAFGQGHFLVKSSTGDTLAFNNGDFDYETEEIICPNSEGCAFTVQLAIQHPTTMSSTNGAIAMQPIGGFNPFEYSINGGQTYVTSNTFSNLTAGTYIISIKDKYDICSYQDTVVLDAVSSTNDLASNDIKVYPNPVKDNLMIQIDENSVIDGNIHVELYDAIGRIIHTTSISKLGNHSKVTISLSDVEPGVYFIKCSNDHLKGHFKVIKL